MGEDQRVSLFLQLNPAFGAKSYLEPRDRLLGALKRFAASLFNDPCATEERETERETEGEQHILSLPFRALRFGGSTLPF